MASIHKRSYDKSPFWWASFKGPTGKPVYRSTKTEVERDAWEIASKWEREAEALMAFPNQSAANLVLEEFISATQLAAEGRFDEHIARKLINRLLELCGRPQLDALSIRLAFEQWLATKDGKAEGTLERYKFDVEQFLIFLGAKADRPLSTLLSSDIEAFQRNQVKQGKTPSTANRFVGTFSIALNYHRRHGHILTNPAEAVDRLEQDSMSKEPFTLEQIHQILAIADEEWKGMIIVGYCTGMRIGDASKLVWSNIDLNQKTIEYRQIKKKRGSKAKPVTTVLLPDLEEYLKSIKQKITLKEHPIFPKLSKIKVSGESGLSEVFVDMISKAGIPNPPMRESVTGKGRQFFKYGYHSFRHTSVSVMENMGVPEEIRRLHVGHTSDAHKHYSHREVESIRASLEKYPRLLKAA